MENNEVAYVLLHGFKSRNSDDFSEMIDYFNQKGEVFNISWFDNYDLSTQTFDHVEKVCKDIADKVSDFKKIIIIGYSTGALLPPIVKKYINEREKVEIFVVGPLIKRYSEMRALGAIKKSKEVNKGLKQKKKELSPEEYEEYINDNIQNKSFDLHMFKNYWFTEKLKLKYRKNLVNENNIHFLLATYDFAIKTPEVHRKLLKKGKDVKLIDFNHGLIFKMQKQIFIDWFEEYEK